MENTRLAALEQGAAIQVVGLRALDGRSVIKAFVDLKVDGVIIKGAKIVQQDGQRPWLAMPSVKNEHGGWNNTVELSKPLRDAATEVVLAAWEARQRDPGQRDTGDPNRPFDDRIPF